MGVLKRFRKTSPLEFFTSAQRLRHDLILLACHDFGIRPVSRSIELLARGMGKEDREAFTGIAQRYGLSRAIDDCEPWIVARLRDSVWQLSRQLVLDLTAANAIYVTNERELAERRLLQDRAIGDCLQLTKEIELAIDLLPIEASRLTPHVAAIDREIALIKGWRKSDARRFGKQGDTPAQGLA